MRGEVLAHKTLPFLIEVSVPSQESDQSCMCPLGRIHFASFYDFSSDSVVFFVFNYICGVSHSHS